ncbi:hypothetical protein B9Z55_027041 [Caenorhabditis nigoni]|uniref:F-box domain-containing protein n=1 Tax=Caenorhabditis nigoni TaxID=1611254 RepID=A0A2G5SIX6_9PELO|nr:hypothetical protein B9Z55_027041 [Caenorhabditis nigoni]
MEMSSDLIKENHHYLKTCILFEVLQKVPIFDSYRKFCDTLGKDAMKYPDFEFWYYRFYHGSRDLDYERSVDPKPKTIMDIPAISMTKIAGYLDPVERTLLRSMNHIIKAVADSFAPVFKQIYITVSNTRLDWYLDSQSFSCYKEGTGCSLRRPNCLKIENSEACHIKKGLEYLAPVFKMPNLQVNYLVLQLFGEMLDRDDLLPTRINVKSVYIRGENMNRVLEFLSAMNPGYLESICIAVSFAARRENDRRIFETEQFKKAKSIECQTLGALSVEDLAIFSHLKTFKCHMTSDNTVEDVIRIRDIISTFEEFQSCELCFTTTYNRFPMREFAEALGEEIPLGPFVPPLITHRYQIPESSDCLEFNIKRGQYCCCVDIVKVR